MLKSLKNKIKRIYWNINSTRYELIDSLENEYVYKEVKTQTYEKVHFAEVYGLSKEYDIDCYSPALNIYKFHNACITDDSDIIVVDKKAYWDKKFNPLFCKTVPLDNNLVEYNNESVKIKNYSVTQYINGSSFSLLGKFASVWAHFLIQYVSKLYFAEKNGLLERSINILLPKYKDQHIKKVVYKYLEGKNVNIIEIDPNKRYICEELYYIPTTVCFPNHLHYFLPQDAVYSRACIEGIDACVVKPFKGICSKSILNKKIYLIRRGTYRSLINWKEVENYFSGQGYILIEPHKLDFDEKVAIFQNAEIIVGPYSSAFTNIIWCSEKTKILLLSNLPRIVESGLSEYAHMSKCRMLFLTGQDKEQDNTHSEYYIGIDRIKEALKYLME